MRGHKCPAPNCPADIPTGTFACRAHWYALPPALRRRLSEAWRQVLAGDDWAAYLAVAREAKLILGAA